ncbi:DUF1622 domain-containing protein [Chloroflexota bacterium]
MNILIAILEYISLAIGIFAFLIIFWGVIRGVIELVTANFTRKKRPDSLSKVRYDLGYHLLVALEFLIAADIIRTIIKPTLEELGILGAIVAIRVVLSYFLHREVDQKTP